MSDIVQKKRKDGFLFISALPNEYLVAVGSKTVKPLLGGRKFKLFRSFIFVPAYVQRLNFSTDNANIDYQGIGIDGYANWRINPENPEKAISTLNFSIEEDPMGQTNEMLRTICIEAVRHVIANMSIDDAMRKKDDIANDLKNQLKAIEDKWGIIFDQVGIEKVKVMSSKLFQDLQSEFRNKLRLNSEKAKLQTDSEIAAQANVHNEKTVTEKLNSDQKIEFQKIANKTKLKEKEMIEQQMLNQKSKELEQEKFRFEITLNTEQEQKNHEFDLMQKNLEIEAINTECEVFKSKFPLEEYKKVLELKNLEIEKMKREISQSYTESELMNTFISQLPEVYGAIKIDNYSVLSSPADDNISPIVKILNELFFVLKNNKINLTPK